MQPLVSVIIPAYNHEKYIKVAIESILKQTYKPLELLIIDDGSKDTTFQKIEELSDDCLRRFKRVYFKKQENQGVIKTLNELIRLSEGEFVYILASDDVSKPSAISTLLDFLVNNKEYALVVGDNEIIDENGTVAFWDRKRRLVYDPKRAKYKTFAEALRCKKRGEKFGAYLDLFAGNHVPNGYLIRKEIFDKTGLYQVGAPLEDWYMNLQIAKYAKMKYLDEVLFSYRWHNENTIKNKSKMTLFKKTTLEYERSLLNNISPEMLSKDMSDCLIYDKQKRVFSLLNFIEVRTVYKNERRRLLFRFRDWDFVV